MGWVIRLAKRIEELHRMGVAHGGLSPSCIVADGPHASGRGELADVRHTAIRPPYHAPERLEGAGISPDDDTWAIAVTLYFLVTGVLPFPGATTAQVLRRMQGSPPAPLAVFDAGDDALQQLIDRFLQRDDTLRRRRLPPFRESLEAWLQRRGQPHPLPPLDEADADSLSDADDEEEEIATVMRDISDVREHLRQLDRQRGVSVRNVPAAPPAPPPPPPLAVTGPPRPPPRAAPGGFPQGYPIDDEDSEEASTVLMDTEAGTEVGDAIAAAMAAKARREAGKNDDLNDVGAPTGEAGTILMEGDDVPALDLSNVPDPTGGEPPRSPAPTSPSPPSPAPPSPSPPSQWGKHAPPGEDDAPLPAPPGGSAWREASGSRAAIEASLDAVRSAYGPGDDDPGGRAGEGVGRVPGAEGGYTSEVDRILAGGALGAWAPQRGTSTVVGPGGTTGLSAAGNGDNRAVRIALVVSSVLLSLVLVWIGLLLAERAGWLTLPF